MTKLVRLRVSAAMTACTSSSASASRADASEQRAMRLLVAEMYVTELNRTLDMRDVKWQLQNRPDAPEVLKRRLVTLPWRPRTRCTRGTLRQIGGRLCTSPSGIWSGFPRRIG